MKTKHDLLTQEGREAAILELNNSYISELRKICEIHPAAYAVVNKWSITLYVKDTNKDSKRYGRDLFASEVDIYINNSILDDTNNPHINIDSTGSFNLSDIASIWRTLHAARIIEHWSDVMKLTEKYCKKCADLEKEVMSLKQD